MVTAGCGRVLRKRPNTFLGARSRGIRSRSWFSTPLWIEPRWIEIEREVGAWSERRIDPVLPGPDSRRTGKGGEDERALFESGEERE
jgi:hypothetical protein